MSYQPVRDRARQNFNEVLQYLNYITSQEPDNITFVTPIEIKIMRGLFYVHLYAALEKTVNDIVQQTLIKVSSHNVKHNHYTIPFNAISLMNRLRSFKDSSYNIFIQKSTEIFEDMTCSRVSTINETAFSNNLQNVWIRTIDEVRKAFGMAPFALEPRVKATVDEVVDKRNAVAHGRENASTIGERHKTDVLRVKMDIVTNFTYQLIDEFETYYTGRYFLKPNTKRYYA